MNNEQLGTFVGIIAFSIFIILILILSSLPNVFIDYNKINSLLENDGYTNIELTGYRLLGCGKDDSIHQGFKAEKNSNEITGIVCGGFFKAYTIRLD